MSKRLVVCCDGTWNRPDQAVMKAVSPMRDAGAAPPRPIRVPVPTNVAKLAFAVSPTDKDGTNQLTYYHPGVGTTPGERLRGGAFGLGLARNVRDAYRFIVDHFEPGDELYLFGFSRGAYTARSVAGFVRNSGVLRRDQTDRLGAAYALYRSRGSHPISMEAQLFRRSYAHETRIRFVGVWDTVGALGIPLNGLRVLNRRNRFHDVALSSIVDAAFHALAVDERRRPFRPCVWLPPDTDGQVVEQVWFSGVHCNVGGGYADHGLSDITLSWMAEKAGEHGLAIDHSALANGGWDVSTDDGGLRPNQLGVARESWKGIYRVTVPIRRAIGTKSPASESASSTAQARRRELAGYHPPNLATYLDGGGVVTPVQPGTNAARPKPRPPGVGSPR